MKELDIQRHLYEQVRKEGGYGHKMSHQFLAGVPDLLLIHPDLGTWVVEVKFLSLPKGYVPIGTTKLQEEHLRRINEAGGKACVIVVVKDGDEYTLYATTSFEQMQTGRWEKKFPTSIGMTKKRGEKWPIVDLLKILEIK